MGKDFIFYSVVLSMVAMDRPTLRTELVSAPEVLGSIKETPHLQDFLESYFYCRYKSMMEHFVPIIDLVRHSRHFMRIMRLNAYKQFLASYRSVKLSAMA